MSKSLLLLEALSWDVSLAKKYPKYGKSYRSLRVASKRVSQGKSPFPEYMKYQSYFVFLLNKTAEAYKKPVKELLRDPELALFVLHKILYKIIPISTSERKLDRVVNRFLRYGILTVSASQELLMNYLDTLSPIELLLFAFYLDQFFGTDDFFTKFIINYFGD